MNNNFYLCNKKKENKTNKSLLFYHVPKCAGTTFSVIFSWLINPQIRLNGPLFKKNDKNTRTAFENFNDGVGNKNNNNFNFIYGHLPFEINEKLQKDYIKITVLRDPIKRSLSHYNWMLNRGYCNDKDSLQDIFDLNKITKNTITNQFSGIGFTNKNTDKSLELAYENLTKKIDYLYNSNNILNLFKLLISIYDLPNLLFQNQQQSKYKNKIKNKEIYEIIKKNNEMDIELYNSLINDKKFYNHIFTDKENDGRYFFSSPNIEINKMNNTIINRKDFETITDYLKKNNLKIIQN